MKASIVGIALAIFALLPSDEAHASFCAEGDTGSHVNWSGFSEIRVYIHQDMASNLKKSNGTVWSNAELRRAIESAVLSFEENLASGLPRMRVMPGYSNQEYRAHLGPGTIHLSANLDPSGTYCGSSQYAYAYYGAADGARITFKRSGKIVMAGVEQPSSDDCAYPWEQWSVQFNTFRGVFNHELMHLMGAKHDNCQSFFVCPLGAWCSCIETGPGAIRGFWNCYRWDQQRIRDAGHLNWGATNPGRKHSESTTGFSWAAHTGSPPVQSPLSGFSDNSLPYLFAASRKPDGTNTYALLWRWVFTTKAWEYWGYVASESVLGSTDVAYGGTPAYPYVSHTGSASNSDPLKEISVTRFTTAGQKTRWTFGSDLTQTDGTSIAHHPGANVFIVVWRDCYLRVHINFFDPVYGFGQAFALSDSTTGNPIYAAEAPSIACGPATAGSKPCVLVWASPAGVGASDYQTRQWVHVGVVSFYGTYVPVLGTVNQQGLVQYGPPQVAYNAYGASNTKFLLSWGEVGSAYYTIGKSTLEADLWDWTTLRSHSSGTGSHGYSPSIGVTSVYYQLQEQFR